jgi:hypothetical protein
MKWADNNDVSVSELAGEPVKAICGQLERDNSRSFLFY